MRIIQLISGLGVGGTETALLRVSRELQKNGHQIQIYVLKNIKSLEAEFIKHNIEVFYLYNPWKWLRLILNARKFNADVLQTWLPHSNLLGAFLRLLCGAKTLVWNVRQTLNRYDQIPKLTKSAIELGAKVSGTADAIVYNSDQGLNDHEKIGYKSKISIVIPNGFATHHSDLSRRNSLRDLWHIPQDSLVFLFVGRDHADKGVDTFFKAALELGKKDHSTHYIFVGKGLENTNSKWAKRTPLSVLKQFHFCGNFSEDKVLDCYLAADVFTSSSISEGFSNVIGEAMAHGLLTVATDVGDSKKIVGNAGWVIAPSNSTELVATWMKILELPKDKKQHIQDAARTRIQENYSLDRCVARYEDLYKQVLS